MVTKNTRQCFNEVDVMEVDAMNETMISPLYLRIALDFASRIADGEIKEGRKISGRSLLASEYGVSPETIRRALKLLADMKVVDIKNNCGVYVLSADNAKRYLKGFEGWNEQQELQQRMKSLLNMQSDINRQLSDVYSEIIRAMETPSPARKPLPNYEVRVSPESRLIGKSIGSLQFWQATGATIVAIRRPQNIILSPGPYAELYDNDIIIFVGEPSTVTTVERFINGTEAPAHCTKQEEPHDTV